MKSSLLNVVGTLTLFVMATASVFAQGNADAGSLKNAQCEGCHGIEGFRMAYPEVVSVPMLGGQAEAYIVAALKAYRAGDRSNATMRAIAVGLSDEDIADLAAYYASGE